MTDREGIQPLLPCPFCGEAANAGGTVTYSDNMVREQEWTQATFYYCNCPSCGVNNQGIVGHKTPDAAITAWNRRAGGSTQEGLRIAAEIARTTPLMASNNRDLTMKHEGAREVAEAIEAAAAKGRK